MVKRTDFTFLSRDAKTYIHAVKWEPEKLQAKAFLQLVHGMTEHIDRYDDFARFVAEKGFIVVGHDHLGHGTSVLKQRRTGDILLLKIRTKYSYRIYRG